MNFTHENFLKYSGLKVLVSNLQSETDKMVWTAHTQIVTYIRENIPSLKSVDYFEIDLLWEANGINVNYRSKQWGFGKFDMEEDMGEKWVSFRLDYKTVFGWEPDFTHPISGSMIKFLVAEIISKNSVKPPALDFQI